MLVVRRGGLDILSKDTKQHSERHAIDITVVCRKE